MKKLINDPADVVADALRGMAAAHPELRIAHVHKIIYHGTAPVQSKVGLVSGGGSGHEPLHGGFVGPGMLDAACAGEVFTSPVPDQILEATKNVDGGADVLHIVKNYTGDVMNFEMAALDRVLPSSAQALLKQVGMTLISNVGGASGPLYGTLFLRMATAAGDVESLDGPTFAEALRAGLQSVVQRDKACAGDKTMIDALDPGATSAAEGFGSPPPTRVAASWS